MRGRRSSSASATPAVSPIPSTAGRACPLAARASSAATSSSRQNPWPPSCRRLLRPGSRRMPMAEARVVNPLVEQFRQGRVPRDLRLMAAQGALPLGPVDLADLLVFLLHDVDQEIRDSASASLLAVPADEMLPLARDRSSLPGLLAWILAHREERELQEAVLQNTTLPDEAIEARASTLPEELAELVVINQVRLLRRTSLLEALEQNQGLSKDQRRRLRELRESFHIGEQPPESAAAVPPPAAPPEPPTTEEPEEEPPPPANDAEAVARYLGA